MFTADSMRGPSLDDRRIFRHALGREGCKTFLRTTDGSLHTDETDWTDLHREQTAPLYLVKAAEVIRGQGVFFTLFHSKSP